MLIGSGITAAVMALAQSARHLVAGYFVNIAMNRNIPPHPVRAERRIAGSCVDANVLSLVREVGNRLAALPHEVVEIQSRDGTRLLGHWMPVSNPRRILIAMHGWRSSWDNDFGMIGDFFRDNHCSVLYAEQRGQGGSGGEYMGFGLTERYDCLDWVNWVSARMGNSLPIYLCGISMGASTVLMASGLALPDNVRGIMADCGYTSPVAIWKHVAKNHLHLSYPMCEGPARQLARKKISVGIEDASCPEALSQCRVPVLFVHGTDDRFVPVEMTYENYKACAAPKRLLIVPGAEHGMSYLVDPHGYKDAVKAFWAEFDTKIV